MHRGRAEIKCIVVFCCFLFAVPRVAAHSNSEEQIVEWIEPASCTNNNNKEYFHTDSLECRKCSNDLVSSDDGYGCVCDKNSKIVDAKEGNTICSLCEAGKIRTTDGYECISCKEHDRGSCGCLGNEITIERSWNGTILDKQRCLPCPKNTYSSIDHSQCLPCSVVSFRDERDHWALDDPSRESLRKYCMPKNSPKDWPDVQSTYIIMFKNKKMSVDSYYLRTELRFTFYSCENGVKKACAQLANMCSLTLFAANSIACKLFMRKTDTSNRSNLFYRQGEAQSVLNRRTIAQRYTLDRRDSASNRLKLVFARFGLRGRFETISETNLPCPFFSNLPFGVNFLKRCSIPAIELTNAKMSFFVPYLSYFEKNNPEKRLLHPLPILIKNINENIDSDDLTRWQLVRRFFSIDKITGYRAITNSKNASFTREPELQALRYIKSLSLVVKLQERRERGKIFPPLLVVEYDELTSREIIENIAVSVEYRVTYRLSEEETNSAIEAFIGVFTVIAVAFSALKAWSYSRRSCKNIANISTIGWFVVYCLGSIGNVLLIICSGFCVYTFIFYKGQKVVHVLLPNRANEWTIRVCTIVAFAFKTVEISSLIYQQRTINIFLIDWEQPRIISEAVTLVDKLNSPGKSHVKYARSSDKFYSSNEQNSKEQTASERIIGARRKKNSSPLRSASHASTSSSRESINNETTIDHRTNGQTPSIVCTERNFSIDGDNDKGEEKNYSVSIWRTCVVANEWLRIKTTRKIDILSQIFVTLFILEIMGGKYWSRAIPELTVELDETLSIDESFTLVYAIGILVYAIVYTIQWWFSVFIYERYIKNQLQEFVDLCSIANISVFILSHDFYGYYIHGRSVHGFADTDLLTLIKDLNREENNLCAHRGLIPGTTEQTFVISLSKTFRTFYDRLLGSQSSSNGKFLRRNISNFPADWDERWKTHLRLRNFFTSFLDHCYKNIDYTVKERHCLEKMCDLEIADVDEKSIFYTDNAYSFDRAIFYGNEWTLATFETNVFLVVLVFGGNYILASIVALLVAKAIKAIVRFNGKRLLASKTFVDERFLVSRVMKSLNDKYQERRQARKRSFQKLGS